MSLTLPLHTVVTLIGPSTCGKSTLAARIAETIQAQGLRTVVVSSDEIRRRILGEHDADRMDPRMLYASDEAFKTFWRDAEMYTSWPHMAPVVILDTTGLSEGFRMEAQNLAERQGYHTAGILFGYKNGEDYLRHTPEDYQTRSMVRHQTRRLKKSMRDLTREPYSAGLHILTSPEEAEALSVRVAGEDLAIYDACNLGDTPVFVVGDVHGCYNELEALLVKARYRIGEDGLLDPEEGRDPIVFTGDIVDKGPDTRRVVEFLYENMTRGSVPIHVVLGNHDSWVYRYLVGEFKAETVADHVHLFDSVELFEADPVLRDKFNTVVSRALPFVKTNHAFVTHTPCDARYVGKVSRWAQRAQRQLRYPRARDYDTEEAYHKAFTEFFEGFRNQAISNAPYHVFGHVPQRRGERHRNQIALDTGCVEGNRLTGVTISGPRSARFVSVSSEVLGESQKRAALPPDMFPRRERQTASWDTLEPREKGRIGWMASRNTNFLSGTMSPSDKRVDGDVVELESLDEAFAYYRSRGVMDLVVQPKHMGSRANVYVVYDEAGEVDVEASYTLSRSGYPVNRLTDEQAEELKHEYVRLGNGIKRRLPKTDIEVEGLKVAIVDAELMPWAALGQGLIDKAFYSVLNGYSKETNELVNTGWYKLIDEMTSDPQFVAFKADWGTLDKKGLKEKYGNRDYGRFSNLLEYLPNHKTLSEVSQGLFQFRNQLATHGAPDPIELRGFGLLKLVYHDGTEIVTATELSNQDQWEIVSGHAVSELYVDPDDGGPAINEQALVIPNTEIGHAQARALFEALQSVHLEGVVIKPLNNQYNVAPYMKVRSPEYLTVVYGPDYQSASKYNMLVQKKRIRRKLDISVSEWALGMKMLAVPYDSISEENEEWRELMAEFIGEEKREAYLDPRL